MGRAAGGLVGRATGRWRATDNDQGARVACATTRARNGRRLVARVDFPGAIDGHLSADWVGKLVGRLLPGAHTMHALRRKFASAAYAVDKDVFVVQELLGHASPVTTRRYVEVPRDDLRRTVNAMTRTA